MAAVASKHLPQSHPPRPSQETDRRLLLDDADSIAPSDSVTLCNTDGDRTPRAHSPAQSDGRPSTNRRGTMATQTPQPYRGFPSEAHYLQALQTWADSQKYAQPDKALVGWYGEKTMEEYASAPRLEFGFSKKWKARKEAKAEARNARRATVV